MYTSLPAVRQGTNVVWNNVIWALTAALVLTVPGTAYAWLSTRRRQRAHAELIRGAVAGMCTYRPDESGRVVRLGREVVDVLALQEEGAALLDSGQRHAEAELLVSAEADMALLIAADAATAAHPLARGRKSVDDGPWQVTDRAPRASEHPMLPQLCEVLRRTTANRIARARLVLAQADQLDAVDSVDDRVTPVGIARVRTALDRGAELLGHADELAESGDTLAALRALARIDLPVPEDGVPGQADAADLAEQTNALARLALRHREALAAHLGVITVLLPQEES